MSHHNPELYTIGYNSRSALTPEKEEPAPAPPVRQEPEREQWGRKLDFLLSCIGYAVGLGNVWRFPYLCYKNGGASFLIPYAICLIFCGIPIFYLEVALGQYVQRGVVGAWASICPMLGGIGLAMLVITFLGSVYYNIIMAWTFFYMFAAWREDPPWQGCDNKWNNALTCKKALVNEEFNCTANGLLENCGLKYQSPEEQYFNDYVLELSDGIDQPGEVRLELAFCLLLAWIIVYFCVWKGIKSAGKVVYFTATFPYVVLFILLIRGATLPGAQDGILFYLKPDFNKLKSPGVWVDAAGQIFFSLSVGFGGLITYGSYNKFRNNCEKDTLIVSLINCGTSLFAGFVIFSTMGFAAFKLNLKVDEVVKGGPGLAFVAYPQGINEMPASPFWAFLFFFMLFNLGLDSQFVGVETCVTVLAEFSPRFGTRYKSIITLGFCAVCYIIGIAHVTQGGMYVFQMFDYQSGGLSLILVALLETIGIGWFYGTEKFSKNIEDMIGHRPNMYFRICWKYISPLIIGVIFLWNCIFWSGITYGDYRFPPWAEFVGWTLCIASLSCVPGYAIYRYITSTSGTPGERIHTLLLPDKDAMSRIERKYGVKPDASFDYVI